MKWIITTLLFAGFIASSCGQEIGGKEQEEADEQGDVVTDEIMTFEDYVSALKQLDPTMPIQGSHFTSFEGQLPNAPRAYRHGYHEGFDFYDGFCGVKIEEGTPVVAIAEGQVVRLDTIYEEIPAEERERLLAEAKEAGATSASTLDLLRGRQVWIDHGSGIITRYCHLSGVVKDLPEVVQGGEVIGFVGGSGTSSRTPHLHFEIRFGDTFFGKGMTPQKIRERAGEIFSGTEGSP